jgi:hypothetical protein
MQPSKVNLKTAVERCKLFKDEILAETKTCDPLKSKIL